MPRCVQCAQWEPSRIARCTNCGGELRYGLPAPPAPWEQATPVPTRQHDGMAEWQQDVVHLSITAGIVLAVGVLLVAVPFVVWLQTVPGAKFSLPLLVGG